MASQRCLKYYQTAVILVIAFITGCNLGIVSPTLPDLQHLTQSTTAQISTIFIWTGLACMLGAILIGPLFDKFDWSVLMIVTLVIEAAAFCATGFCRVLIGVSLILSIESALKFGALTGVFSTIMRLWSDEPTLMAPMVQFTDLIHVAGSAVIPQIVAPFLKDYRNTTATDVAPITQTESVFPLINSSVTWNPSMQTDLTNQEEDEIKVKYAYILLGVMNFAVAVLCVITRVILKIHHNKYDTIVKKEGQFPEKTTSVPPDSLFGVPKMKGTKCTVVIFISSLFVVFWANGGRDVLMAGLLYSYVTNFLSFSVEEGTLLVTMYHVVRVVVHFLIVVVSRWVRPLYILLFDMVFFVAAPVVLMLTVEHSEVSVWICVMGIAIGTSNVQPTSLSLVQESVETSGKVVGIFNGAIALGIATFSPLAGVLLETDGVLSFPAVLLGAACAALVLLIPWWFSAKQIAKMKQNAFVDGIQTESFQMPQNRNEKTETSPLLENKLS